MFAILIAIIFVYESLDKLMKIKKTHQFSTNPFLYQYSFNENSTECFRCRHKNTTSDPREYYLNDTIYTDRKCDELGPDYEFTRNCDHVPDVYFFCVILYVCTFCLAIVLRKIRSSSFFPSSVS